MTNDGASKRPQSGAASRAGKRAIAREKAQALRDGQRKKERRNRRLLVGGGILAALVVVAVVVGTIWSQIPTSRVGPVNMLSDGIKIGEGFVAEPTAGLKPGDEPVPSEANAGSEVIDIRIYLDYQCAGCRAFEEANHGQLATWLETGAATVEFHPISLFDRYSLGTKYSTRAANAAACVATYSPNSFFDFNSLMFANQPDEGTEGLTDEQITVLAKRANVTGSRLVEDCIVNQNYKPWVNSATARAIAGPIPNSTVDRVERTPTVIVNGVQYTGALEDAEAFAMFASTSAGNAFTEKSATETPSPTEPAEPDESEESEESEE